MGIGAKISIEKKPLNNVSQNLKKQTTDQPYNGNENQYDVLHPRDIEDSLQLYKNSAKFYQQQERNLSSKANIKQ